MVTTAENSHRDCLRIVELRFYLATHLLTSHSDPSELLNDQIPMSIGGRAKSAMRDAETKPRATPTALKLGGNTWDDRI